jgi:hypothetical protein
MCCGEHAQGETSFINSGKMLAVPSSKTHFSHFNCITFVKRATTFFRTAFFGRAFAILFVQSVEQTRKKNMSCLFSRSEICKKQPL